MQLDFAKLHGLGNDFVFIDDFSLDVRITEADVRFLCDRHFGIGADGVILVRPSERPECVAYMHYINSDGTLAQMCGNGVRCFAKYLVDRGYVPASAGSFIADTLAGPRRIEFEIDDADFLTTATVNMGDPVFAPALVPVRLAADAETADGEPFVKSGIIPSPWGDFSFTCLSMGNPHAVCFIEDFSILPDGAFIDASHKSLDTLDVEHVGAFFEANEAFPDKANIEFACTDGSDVHMRVYERGCGETLACGTGACATAVAACLNGLAGRVVDVVLRGGALHVAWSDEGFVLMTGPAAQSFEGSILISGE